MASSVITRTPLFKSRIFDSLFFLFFLFFFHSLVLFIYICINTCIINVFSLHIYWKMILFITSPLQHKYLLLINWPRLTTILHKRTNLVACEGIAQTKCLCLFGYIMKFMFIVYVWTIFYIKNYIYKKTSIVFLIYTLSRIFISHFFEKMPFSCFRFISQTFPISVQPRLPLRHNVDLAHLSLIPWV